MQADTALTPSALLAWQHVLHSRALPRAAVLHLALVCRALRREHSVAIDELVLPPPSVAMALLTRKCRYARPQREAATRVPAVQS